MRPSPIDNATSATPVGDRFDDLTGTIFADHRQPLRTWITCLYLMGLNLSGLQIAKELDLNKDDVRAMIQQLRQGIVDRRPPATLSGEVECDEVYVVAGHKGIPRPSKKRAAAATTEEGAPGRGTLAKEKPPIFGMFQRGGEVVIRMLEDVKQVTIGPLDRARRSPKGVWLNHNTVEIAITPLVERTSGSLSPRGRGLG